MKQNSYTPERRIVSVGLATVDSALLETMGSLRPSMSDGQQALTSLLVWDTGARSTTLSERVVDALNLQPTGRTKLLSMADGRIVKCKTYIIYVQFTFGDYYGPYEIPALPGMDGCDLLVGLDFILKGELHVDRIEENKVEFVFIMHK